jgi:hypothetical protein
MGDLLAFTPRPVPVAPTESNRMDLEIALDEARHAYDNFACEMDIESADDRRELLRLSYQMDAIREQLGSRP